MTAPIAPIREPGSTVTRLVDRLMDLNSHLDIAIPFLPPVDPSPPLRSFLEAYTDGPLSGIYVVQESVSDKVLFEVFHNTEINS